jgi:hypothetical protein
VFIFVDFSFALFTPPLGDYHIAFENKWPTLVPTSAELTSTTMTMASQSNQVVAPSATKLVLPITGGSSSEQANKKQKKEAQRRVQHVGVQGPFIKSKWSHISITFSQEDLQLKDYPHNDAMVIYCVIKGFLVHNVLLDTSSAANIIFAKAFRQMQEPDDKIHNATHPLCGFGGRQIVALSKITMSVTFGYVHNTRTRQVCNTPGVTGTKTLSMTSYALTFHFVLLHLECIH